MLHPDQLTPEALAMWLENQSASTPSLLQLDMRGLERLPAMLAELAASAPVAEVI
ncbi:hypothetical protein ACFSC4_24920 [Deinococcus malanensis]|uniref:hypothetical protein n=1 Tax=Deinococcus malanensis TaxID=1706855 RepID=UPI00363C126C